MNQFNLRQEVKKMVMILSGIPDGIAVVDKEGRIIFSNPTAEVITAYLGADILGKKIDQVFKFQCEKNDSDVFFVEILKGEKAVRFGENCRLIRNDGQLVPLEMIASPIYDEVGDFHGSLIALRDLTEEQKIKNRQREFLSFVSHQLRLPLGSFRWGIEIMLSDKKKLDPVHRELMEDLYNVVIRLVAFVHDLLEISRLEEGRIELKPSPVNIVKIIKETFEEFKNLATGFNIKVSFFPSLGKSDNLPNIFVDPDRFKDIFRNLISNGLTFNTIGGSLIIEAKQATSEEILKLTRHNNLVQGMEQYLESVLKKNGQDTKFLILSIADAGLGIPKNEQPKIFSSFFRARNAIEKSTSGSGSGLYFTKAIVENSGGRIFFESEENKGTTFYLIFPTL